MRRILLSLAALAAASTASAAQAQAQASAAPRGGSAAASPDVTVTAPERLVCRAQVRTSTRMRTGRVCRTVREWEEARGGRSQDEVLAEAADTLEMVGEKVSTNCLGGMGGPR